MFRVLERRTLSARLVFDPEDLYARDRLGPAAHPRPLEPLRFWLIERDIAGARTVYEPPRELRITRNPSGYHLFFGQERITGGSFRDLHLADGNYLIRITGDFYQSVEQTFALPMPNPDQPVTLSLEPNYAYPFPHAYPARPDANTDCATIQITGRYGPTLLRGGLHTPAGEGLEGARVAAVSSSNQYQTDQRGQWVLWFPDDHPSGPVNVRVTLSDGTVLDTPDVCVVQGRETSRGITAAETTPAETALRGWVTRSGVGVENATVEVSGQADQATSMVNGRWLYAFPPNQASTIVSVTATLPAPDGRNMTANNVLVRPPATVTVPTFRF
jgi:hypothetical protein